MQISKKNISTDLQTTDHFISKDKTKDSLITKDSIKNQNTGKKINNFNIKKCIIYNLFYKFLLIYYISQRYKVVTNTLENKFENKDSFETDISEFFKIWNSF